MMHRRIAGRGGRARSGGRLLAITVLAAGLGACSEASAPDASPEADGGGTELPADVESVTQAASSGVSGTTIHLNLQGFHGADTYLTAGYGAYGNAGAATKLLLGNYAAQDFRPLIWFNTWQLPRPVSTSAARITLSKSTLSLENLGFYTGSSTTLPIVIAPPGSFWTEGTGGGGSSCPTGGGATWFSPNCAQSGLSWTGGSPGTALVTTSISTTKGVKTITIPTSAITSANKSEVFNGWVIRTTNTTDGTTLTVTSRDGFYQGVGASAPQLDLDYTCATGYQNDHNFGPGGCTGSAGSACRSDDSGPGMCASGACASGKCLADNGLACTSNAQCISGSCVSGTCAGYRSATVGATRDTYVQSANSGWNRGGAAELLNGKMLEGSATNTYRPIVQMKLPTLPAPVVVGGVSKERIVVDSMKLKLTQVAASPDSQVHTGNLRRLTTAWTEGSDTTQTTCTGGATNARPNCTVATSWPTGALTGTIVATAPLDMYNGQKIWNLPASELGEMRKTTSHYGFVIDLGSAPTNSFRNFSSDEGNAVWGGPRPTLVVNWHCAPGYTQGGNQCLGDDGSTCASSAECGNGSCIDGICCKMSCSQVQCGSVCGKSCARSCAGTATCQGNYCVDHCTNGVKDADETYKDCGGSCAPCNCVCEGGSECGMTSTCGTSCGTCPATETCFVATLDYLTWGTCVPHCNNNYKDADETGVDCGGSCGPCLSGCTCVGKACGAQDGCGNLCTEGACPDQSRPVAATLPTMNNDTFAQAQQNSLGTINGRWVGVRGDTAGLTDRGDTFGCTSDATAKDAYYHFRVCSTTSITVDTEGSVWDTVVGIFPGRTLTFSTNTVTACDADSGTGNNSSITRTLAAGDYYVVVRGQNATSSGAFNLYLRDDGVLTPTCGGAGVPGQCGVFSRCGGSEVVETLPGGTVAYVAATNGLEGHPTTLNYTSSTSETNLLFDGAEQGLTSRWTATGSVTTSTAAVQPDTQSNRASNSGFRLSGYGASMQTKVDLFGFKSVGLRFNVRATSLIGGESLTAHWSADDGRTWTQLGAAQTSASWVTFNQTFSASTASVLVKLQLNLLSGFSLGYADVDNVQLSSRAGSNSTVTAKAVSGTDGWRLCDANGVAQTTTASTFAPPTASDFCPAIEAPCTCPADPTKIRANATCTSDGGCQAGEICAKVPGDLCGAAIGVAGATSCAEDANGFLAQKYCTKPLERCDGLPAIGCFGGATSRTVGSVTYNQCNNPAEEPCKVLNECPAGDAIGTPNAGALPANSTTPAAPQVAALATLAETGAYKPIDASMNACTAETLAQNGATTHSTLPGCDAKYALGSMSLSDDIYSFSNCDNNDETKRTKGLGNAKFDIDFTPHVFKHVMVKDLPLGAADVKVDAGLDWSLRPTVWGKPFTLLGLSAMAAVDRCDADVHADITILDQDIDARDLRALMDGVISDSVPFPYVAAESAVSQCRANFGLPISPRALAERWGCDGWDKGCIDDYIKANALTQAEVEGLLKGGGQGGFIDLLNRAKKALVDARRAANYWTSLGTNPMDKSFCDATKYYFGIPSTAPCDEKIINAWVDTYQRAANAVGDKLPAVANASGFGYSFDQKGAFDFLDERVPFDVLAVSFAFPVGPLSVLMEVSAGGYWGIGGKLEYEMDASGLMQGASWSSGSTYSPPREIAHVSTSMTPEAGAWARLFVGVGVGNDFIGAHVGVQGELELVGIKLPVIARGALRRSQMLDTRAVGGYADGTLNSTNPPPQMLFGSSQYRNKWEFAGDVNAGLDIHALDGRIDLAARIKLIFYTLQIHKMIAKWSGLHPNPIQIVGVKGAVNVGDPFSFKAMGPFSADVPFPVMSAYQPWPGRPTTPVLDAAIISKLGGVDPTTLGWRNSCELVGPE